MNIEKIRRLRNNHIEAGEYNEAIQCCNLLASHKNNKLTFDDWFKAGLCHFNLDQNDQAIRNYSKALEIEPSNYQAMTNKAISLLRIDKIGDAFQWFRKALYSNSNIGPAWINIGVYFLDNMEYYQNGYQKAVTAFRHAVRIIPDLKNREVYIQDKYLTIEKWLDSSKDVEDIAIDRILTCSVCPDKKCSCIS